MSHLAYYDYQATARGIRSIDDVKRNAADKAYIYDRLVVPWLPAKDVRIVELACGHGAFLHWLKERGYFNVEGVDSSSEQTRFAEQIVVTHRADVIDWLRSQKERSCAALVAIDFIEHISKDAFMDLFGEASRVLQDGGRLILRYPNGGSPMVGFNLFADITHIWTYTPGCLQTLATMHGFTKVEFVDEGYNTYRDNRWFKVPLGKISTIVLRSLFQAATKVRIDYWSPFLWASLSK